ncbi:MAG: TIGR02679 family protein [Lachnospiraceae bacterium]|nr:TIGR02679 family protein [Lachnospiraceae bacterium]
MNLLEECVLYLKQYPVYEKLMEQFRKKYVSLGHIGGTAVILSVSKEEIDQLEGFLGAIKPASDGSFKITAGRFEKALKNSRFGDISLKELLLAFFGEDIKTKREQQELFQENWSSFFETILSETDCPEMRSWLEDTLEKKRNGYQLLYRKYIEDKEELKKVLFNISQAANHFPVKRHTKMRLPVFAAKITGNPHYFDETEFAGKLWMTFLSCGTKIEDELSAAERNWHCLYRVGILKDDLWNYVLTYGICGIKEDGKPHSGLEGFRKEKEPIHMSLFMLGNLETAYGREKTIYVVENPSVFSALIDYFPENISVVCTNGQLHLAAFVLLDLLKENGFEFLYAGDFDPEGLGIADRLKERYEEAFHLWLYEEKYYEKAVSSVKLEKNRLSQLGNLSTPQLIHFSEYIKQSQKAGYQERLIEDYIQSIRERKKQSHEF